MTRKLKLNQILAHFTSTLKAWKDGLTNVHRLKPADVLGLRGRYVASDEDGEHYPDEVSQVKNSIPKIFEMVMGLAGTYVDVAAARDYSNTSAFADVIVGDQVLLSKVPVTFLLTLDSMLTDLSTWVEGLPTLDSGEVWTWDPQDMVYKGREVTTQKVVNEKTPLVLYPATEKHPAQVQVMDRPRVVGHWTRVKFSGGIPVAEKRGIQERVELLQRAVRQAREEANMAEAAQPNVSGPILDYIFAPVKVPRS